MIMFDGSNIILNILENILANSCSSQFLASQFLLTKTFVYYAQSA